MNLALTAITDAIRRAQDDGITLSIWWRDDDAISATPALDRLLALGDAFKIPIGLAVIPAHADHTLSDRLRSEPRIRPMVHGLTHANHEPEGRKRSEFGAGRPLADVVADARQALALHRDRFGAERPAWFVPPWNRISPDLAASLASLGYAGLSVFRDAPLPTPGLQRLDTHIDPIDWHGSRSAIPWDQLASETVNAIEARRAVGLAEAAPIGLLTHHLVHDEAIWTMAAKWLESCADQGLLKIEPS